MRIETERCFCEALSEKDFKEVLDMYQEDDSNKYIAPLLNKSQDFYQEFLEKKIRLNKIQASFWTVRSKAEGTFIGTINLNQFAQTGLIHIGCHLSRNFWQQGYASELMEALLKYGFEERKLRCIHGVFEKENTVSQRLLEKLGFRPYESRWVEGKELWVYRCLASPKNPHLQ